MDADWQSRVKELFLAVRGKQPEQRGDYLDRACRDNTELRREVDSLLLEHDRQGASGAGGGAGSRVASAINISSDRNTEALIGETLGRYRILGLVGKGGMGAVYEAEDPQLRRMVALKVLPAEFADDPRRLARFQREARAVAALSHPNIVTIHSVEESDDAIHFLTMELVEGEPLDRLIPEHGLDLGEILNRGAQLADGLRAAHERGIVHRDLKPANVIVDTEGRVRILDFGLAKALADERDSVDSDVDTSLALTAQGTVLGTAPYMSPEQVAGKACDHRSDIFSLGSILYEMSTGRRPFQGESFTQVMSAILQDEPTPVSELRSDLPEGLERIIERCLEKDPAKRFQTSGELRDALREQQQRVPVARRSGAAGWAALAVAIALVAAVGLLWMRQGAQPTAQIESPAAAPDTKPVRPMIAVLPFQNLGSSQDDYFAIGMTEEVANRMGSVRGVGVIATSSTRQYANTKKTAEEIGSELGAGYLVTGSILWAHSEDGSSRIRITPQLVSTVDDTQIWARSYDRALEDIFAVQAEIASQIVEHLGISLSEPERAAVERFPTDNLEAYDAFLRGVAITNDLAEPSSIVARIEEMDRAVELDPGFALAWFHLTNSHSNLLSSGSDISEDRRRLAREAAQRVEEAAPGSALAAAAMGNYQYRVERDYDRALEELTRAVELDPNNDMSYWLRGSVLRRKGDFVAAVESYEKAVAIAPRSSNSLRQLGIALQHLRRNEEAVDTLDRSIALLDNPGTYQNKVMTLWSWDGHLEAARQVIEAMPARRSPTRAEYLEYWQAVYEGDFRAAADRLRTSRSEWLGMPVNVRPKELLTGWALLRLGDPDPAREQFELAVAKLQARLIDTPDHAKVLSSLGVALAALGRRDEAIEAALRATEIVSLARDPWFAQTHIEDLAWVYTLLGDYDSALEQLEILLERPSRLTISFLKLDPRWAPLLDQPRFKALEERFG